ncbi:MAG: hypothetical protein NC489_46130 [Ruminococcus flavefaciens]|nr:hypothetical protein [Ruminococcus flavefaciens]
MHELVLLVPGHPYGPRGMPWITPHTLFSLTWAEWGSIITILIAVIAAGRWLIKKAKDDLIGELVEELKGIRSDFKDFQKWQDNASNRLKNGDEKFIHHDEQLQDHERRISYLEEYNHEH